MHDTPPQNELQSLIGHYDRGQFHAVIAQAAELTRRYPNAVLLHNIAGAANAGLGHFAEAVLCFDKALRIEPGHAETYNNRGIALHNLNRLDEAIASFDRALQLKSNFPDAHYNRGLALQDLNRTPEALASFETAVRLQPNAAEFHQACGNALHQLDRLDEALASYDRALRLRPNLVLALYNRGNVLRDLHREAEALASYDQVLKLAPTHVETVTNRGNILWQQGRLEDALASYDTAARLKPSSGDIHRNRGNVLRDLDRLDEALASYDHALRIKPDSADAWYNRTVTAARMCAWDATRRDAQMPPLDGPVAPFLSMILADDPSAQFDSARAWVQAKYPPVSPPAAAPSPARAEKIRIGYFSSDFRDHAVMMLAAGMFEHHDKSRFELHAYAYGPDIQDPMRQRVEAAFDHFHDVRTLDDAAVVAHARQSGIDIAIDLNGHTGTPRLGLFARRAAPVQINYLGYPGTIGADFIDYIIADRQVVPPESRPWFTEKVIALPHSYQANDDRRLISDRRFERAELGLPAHGFVFCCFNNSYKISPAEYDIWMRLLAAVDGSVLWLLGANRWAEANLRHEAQARGIDPARLVFAEKAPPADHLARQRQADLFLDTFNYNAHTTASDALWAGLPVVTMRGKSFAARVAASLLHAVDLPELITDTPETYEHLALALATDPARLAALRTKLAANRPTTPLFDTPQFTRDIEQAYTLAHQRRLDGLQPDHIDIG